ncbi:MAG: hypothetical protein AAB289_13835, partial [Chloroflexota bacterium]
GGRQPVRIASGPCGLARDLRHSAAALTQMGHPAAAFEWWGLDLDASGTVLAEAQRRAAAAGLELRPLRVDLLAPGAVTTALGSPVDIFNCIGLTAWLDLPEVAALLRSLAAALAPGGFLVIDNFHRHAQSRFGDDFEMNTRYHDDRSLEALCKAVGFDIESVQETPNRVNVVYTLRLNQPSGG